MFMKTQVIKLRWLFHCRPVFSCKVLEWHCKMFYQFFFNFQSWAMLSNLNFRGFECFGFGLLPLFDFSRCSLFVFLLPRPFS